MSFVVQRWYSGGYCPHFEWKSLSFCKPRVSSSLFLGLSLCSLKFDAHKMYSNWMHRLCRDAQTYLYIYRDTQIYLYIYIHMYILCTPSVCVYLYIYMYTETFEAGKEILAVDTHSRVEHIFNLSLYQYQYCFPTFKKWYWRICKTGPCTSSAVWLSLLLFTS